MKSAKYISLVVVLVVGIFGAALFVRAKARPTSVRVHFETTISPIDPNAGPGQNWGLVINQVLEKLFRLCPNGNLKPQLVKDWSTNSDFTVFRFQILDNVLFHNGQKLAAEDVVYSFNHLKQIPPDSNASFMLKKIREVKSVGPLEVEVTLKEPVNDFLYFLAGPTIRIFPNGIFEKAHSPLELWVGTGPFRLVSLNEKAITLERFDKYREPVKIEKLSFVPSDNPKAAFDSGEIDVFEIARKEVSEYAKDRHYEVNSYPQLGLFFLGFNLRNPVFRDANLRRAILLAIDRSKMVEGVTIEPKFIPSSVIPFGLLGYQSATEVRNLKMARHYLSLVPPDRRPKASDMVVLVPRDLHPMGVYAIEQIQKNLRELGLPFRSEALKKDYGRGQLGDYYHHLRTTHDFKLYFRGLISPLPSTKHVLEEVFEPDSPMNFGGYQSQKYSQYLKTPPATLLESALHDYYSRLSKIVMEDVPVVPLGNLYMNQVTRPEMGLKLSSLSPYFVLFKDAL